MRCACRGKIRRTVLKSVGIVPILLEYLANPLHLYCASALIGNDERQLCLELLQPPAAGPSSHASSRSGHTATKPSMSSKGGESESQSESESESESDEEDEELQETCSSEGEGEEKDSQAKPEAAPAAELNTHTSKDDQVRRILYALSRRMLKLTFHFLVGNAGNQDAFRRDNGLRRLYAMLNDVALRGPILRVVSIIAIGSSSTSAGATSKSETGGGEDVGGAIIRDIISVLQSSGGTSALSKDVRISCVCGGGGGGGACAIS